MCLIHYCFKTITNKIVDEEMEYLIIDKECDINSQDYYGESCIHYLAKYTYNNFIKDNSYIYNITYEEKINEYTKLLKKIFTLLTKRKTLDINLVNNQGLTAFQIAIENQNFEFIEEILKLNPKLCFKDNNGNTIFHCFIPFIYNRKISNDKKEYVLKEILDKLGDTLSDDELNKISNTYDGNGFTPILKIMDLYYQNINTIYGEIKNEIYSKYKIYNNFNNYNNFNTFNNYNNFNNINDINNINNFNSFNIFNNNNNLNNLNNNKNTTININEKCDKEIKEKFNIFIDFFICFKKIHFFKNGPNVKN